MRSATVRRQIQNRKALASWRVARAAWRQGANRRRPVRSAGLDAGGARVSRDAVDCSGLDDLGSSHG